MTRMRQFSRQSFVMVAILLLASLTTAGGFWWLCTRSNEIAFLPRKPGAEWIVYPKPPDTATHRAVPVRAVFRQVFTLDAASTNAALAVCAFKSIAITINGQKVGKIESAAENWKSPSTADVTGLLRAGTNDITAYVTNVLGPPALWLRFQTGQLSLGTDEHWQVSLAGAAWQDARCATRPPVILPWNHIYGGEGMLDSVKRGVAGYGGIFRDFLGLVLDYGLVAAHAGPLHEPHPDKTDFIVSWCWWSSHEPPCFSIICRNCPTTPWVLTRAST